MRKFWLYWNDRPIYAIDLPREFTNEQVIEAARAEAAKFPNYPRDCRPEVFDLKLKSSVIKIEVHVIRR